MATIKPVRRLPLQGTKNTRDIGGYPCAKGTVQWGVFVRSDNPGFLTAKDVEYLRDYGVADVVDLRREEEASNHPSVLVGAEGFTVHPISVSHEHHFNNIEGDVPGSMSGLYIAILEESKAEVAQVMRVFANAPGAVLFHCAVGKDRTGIMAMLLLDLAGVNEADIVADYAVTEIYMREIYEAQREVFLTQEVPDYVLRSRPASMTRVMAHLRDNYGTARGYLQEIGLTAAELERLEARLVLGDTVLA